MRVQPFMKFPGGKRYLADTIISHFPKEFNCYWEPMIGGGAVLFELISRGMVKKAMISDINPWLMTAYEGIRNDPQTVITQLKSLKKAHKQYAEKYGTAKKFYYKVRKHCNKQLLPGAAFTIYLSKTCFNGLFRFNKKGQFNAPFGKHENPSLFSAKNLLNVSTALNQYTDFGLPECTHNLYEVKKHDLVYLDPPYWPVKESSFTSYNKVEFMRREQELVARFAKDLRRKRAYVVISNSDTPAVRELYKGFNIVPVQAPRRINRDGKGRGNVTELLIKSF